MKYILKIIALLAFNTQIAYSCINQYRVLLNGDLIFTDKEHRLTPRGRFNKNNTSFLQQKLRTADSIYKVTGRIEDYSDYGSMLVYTGQYLKAKQIFIEIQKRSPDLYITAANLGTIYELLGQNDSAYYWIDKALKINPDSHGGSEWIHLKILEMKIKSRGDAGYLSTHSLLNLDFGQNKIPQNNNKQDLKILGEQIYDQLNERISFIKPKDPLVAQLLFDLGNISAITSGVGSGLKNYTLAKTYGFESEILEKRISYFGRLQFKADMANAENEWKHENPLSYIIFLACYPLLIISGAIIIIILSIKHYRSKKTKTSA